MKIKVLHCLETIGTGGVEQRRLSLAKMLDRTLFEQHIVCSHIIEDFNQKIESEGVGVSAIGSLSHVFNLKYYYHLFKVVRKFKPHIIHGAVFEGVISAVVAGFFLRIPVIIIEETSDPQNRKWRGHFLMKICSIIADYVVAISPAVATYLRETIHVKNNKLRLITNGVSVPSEPDPGKINLLRETLGLNHDSFVCGSVGRLLDAHKRLSDLIRATAQVKNIIPQLKVIIVGDGPDRMTLEKLAADSGVSEMIFFVGHQRDTSLFYAVMDIFAIVSDREGFGLVAAEAMFFKLPVIATRVGGLQEIVLHEKTGLLVERRAPAEIASSIYFLFKNQTQRIAMGMAGYQRATQEYSAERYVNRVHQLYEEACQTKKLKIKLVSHAF